MKNYSNISKKHNNKIKKWITVNYDKKNNLHSNNISKSTKKNKNNISKPKYLSNINNNFTSNNNNKN